MTCQNNPSLLLCYIKIGIYYSFLLFSFAYNAVNSKDQVQNNIRMIMVIAFKSEKLSKNADASKIIMENHN